MPSTVKSRTKKGIFLSLIGLLIVCLYFKTFISLFATWRQSDYYSHAFLIPIVSAFLVWHKRKELRNLPFEGSFLGLGLVLLGLLLLFIGTYGDVLFLRALSFVVLLAGVILHLFGKKVMRLLRFPIFFLIFMAPAISVLEAISLRLQLLAASFASLMLGIFGMPVVLDGLTIQIKNFSLTVEMPCSGLSSLLSMSALAFLYVHLLSGRNGRATKVYENEINFKRAKEVVVLLSVVPIVILANSFRIAVVAVVGHYFGENAASVFFHFGSGLLIFFITLALLIMVGYAFGLSTDFYNGLNGLRFADSNPLNPLSESADSNWRYFSLIALLVLGNIILFSIRQPVVSKKTSINENIIPFVLGHWRGENREMAEGKCINRGAEVQICREYTDEQKNSVWLVFVYSRNRRALHLPERLYQAYGYNIVTEGQVKVRIVRNANDKKGGKEGVEGWKDGGMEEKEGLPVSVASGWKDEKKRSDESILEFSSKLLIVEKGEERETVIYLLTDGEKVTHNFLVQQLSGIWNRLTGKGKGWALVRVFASCKDTDDDEVSANLGGFLELLIPEVLTAGGKL